MRRRLARASAVVVLVTAASLAVPVLASAYQKLTITGKTLKIDGDQDGKVNDLITVRFSPGTGPGGTDEYVITHDVVDPLPAGCYAVGGGPPYMEVHCPVAGIDVLFIDANTGDNTVDLNGMAGSPLAKAGGFAIAIQFQAGGNNKLIMDRLIETPTKVTGGSGRDDIQTGAGADDIQTGAGNDQVDSGDGGDQIDLGSGDNQGDGGAGDDTIKTGPGSSKVTAGAGNDQVALDGSDGDGGDPGAPVGGLFDGGDGNDFFSFPGGGSPKIIGGNGNDSVFGAPLPPGSTGGGMLIFDGGPGDDILNFFGSPSPPPFFIFTGDQGNDLGLFGNANDKFFGGGGKDKAKLGGGNDKADGGTGNDNLNGGDGRDKLDGGKGRDKLKGGPGPDKLITPQIDLVPDLFNGGDGFDHCNGNDSSRYRNCEVM